MFVRLSAVHPKPGAFCEVGIVDGEIVKFQTVEPVEMILHRPRDAGIVIGLQHLSSAAWPRHDHAVLHH